MNNNAFSALLFLFSFGAMLLGQLIGSMVWLIKHLAQATSERAKVRTHGGRCYLSMRQTTAL